MAVGTHHTRREFATDDWITPPEIIRALGPFGLDPCACDPQPVKTATMSFTANGLTQRWPALRVWLNPPYGAETGRWLGRLAEHNWGTALVFARTETRMFFQHVWPKASALLFIEGRLHFYYPDGTRAKANSGGPSVLIAYGEEDASILMACSIKGAKINLRREI
jgi:hypothetical protein